MEGSRRRSIWAREEADGEKTVRDRILARNKSDEKDIFGLRFIASLSKGQKPYTIQFDGYENSRNQNDRTFTRMGRASNGLGPETKIVKSRQYIYIYFYFVFSRTRRPQR